MTRCSVFTPSHSPRYLAELARSLGGQTFRDWEWVLLVNGGLTRDAAEAVIAPLLNGDFKRVRIEEAPPGLPRTIGALKGEAARRCRSEVLVEADHDDVLLPDCLAEVMDAFDEGGEFVYSNMAPFWHDTRDGDGIWCATAPTRPVRVNGRILHEGVVVPPSPHMLFKAGTCGPVHVRAWRRDIYQRVGGHNPALTLMDDCELIARTYCEGARFHHIDRCLYLYRVERNGGIQTSSSTTARVAATEAETYYERLLPRAILRWCYDKGLLVGDAPEAVDADRPDAFGAFFITSQWSGSPGEILAKIHSRLCHGGWVVGQGLSWDRQEVLKLAYPRHRPPTRYQLHHLEGGTWSPFTRTQESLTFHCSAKKLDEPLPGEDYWHPRVNEVDLRKLAPIVEGMGCGARLDQGRIVVWGAAAEEVVAVVRSMSPFYEELVQEAEDEVAHTMEG